MKQARTKIRFATTPLDVLSTPPCETCGGRTRFVGLEASANTDADLCTYECTTCQHVQVATLLRANGADDRGTAVPE